MDEKEPTFTVTDRRKFTLDGELRDDAPAVEQQEEKPAAPPVPEKVVTMPAPETKEEAAVEAGLPQFTAQETAEQRAAYQESSRQIDDMLRQANPDMGPTGVIGFEHIIQSFYVSAMIALGAGTEPGQKARVDILGARQSIDMLALLQEKTKGNLTQKEEATLQNVLFELRMMFLEITNAIAQSAQRAADGKKK
ncbi:MAG: DUF1844 domain-containing protein [Acidobacteriaceae bacterium]